MSESERDIQRKKLIYRATHRGTKEADAIIGGFVTAKIDTLSDIHLDSLEKVLDQSDADLMDWLRGRRPMPVDDTWDILSLIKDYQQKLLAD